MSALGDYVHLHKTNYLRYGTSEKGPKQRLRDSLQAQKEKTEDRIKQLKPISEDALAELKARMANESNQKKAMDIAKNQLKYENNLIHVQDEILDKWSEILISTNFGKATKGIKIKPSLEASSFGEGQIKNAQKAQKNIYKKIDQINKQGVIEESDVQYLNQQFRDFFQNLNFVKIDQQIQINKKDLDGLNSIAALKHVMDTLAIQNAKQSALHGRFGENLVNMCSDTIINLTGKNLEEALEKAVETGELRTGFSMDSSMVTEGVNNIFQEKTGTNLYTIRATQNKVDASIIINDTDIENSVKAYTPKVNTTSTHLQTVNLIYALATTEAQFANHWLNLHSLQTGINSAEIDEELTKHIQYQALSSGNLLKKGVPHATAFAAIDVVKGRVVVKTVPDLLNNYFNRIKLSPKISNYRINSNVKAATWEERIANILVEMHNKQISVSLSVNFKTMN